MCGICGWVSFDGDLRGRRETVENMTETMSCRGPDDSGVHIEPHAALGHRRLAIIDLPGGRQPMTVQTDQGELTIVYSGETYNYTELRTELQQRGHRFETDSDTEVVLRGYAEWGASVAERLNGMYAFAIWDARVNKLVMIRDRMGIKPFYYYPTKDGVLFGSEPKAILANPLAERVVDADGMRELFAFVKTPGHAVWSGMREVEPGTVVTVDSGGIHRHVYWTLETKPHNDDQETSVARVRELMDDIVARQLVSDVPRCALLSGGLDSSAMTALAAQQLGRHGETVRSFAVDFVGQTENFTPDELRPTPDGPYVHDVAEHVRSQHRDITLDPGTLSDPDVRRKVIGARDIPAGLGDMDASLYLLFAAIREQSTVALSGESADEVFGGYKWFHDPVVQQTDNFPWITASHRNFGEAERIFSPELYRKLDLPQYVADSYATAIKDVDRLDGESDFEYRMRKISYLHLTRFVRNLLDRKDRMSMAVGLEVRVPFCDHRLVDYVYNAPWSLKTYDGREKSLLRGATADVLPQSVVERVKSPYPSTQDPKYALALQQQVDELLSNRNDPVFDLVSADELAKRTKTESAELSTGERNNLERALDLAEWLRSYRPEIRL
jgi:asparagine synthase (glutamine-hydrolysing)